jgi:hypothetical protein
METFGLVIITILGAVTLIAFFVLMDVFFSQIITRIRQVSEQAAGRSFLLGLVNFLFFGAICVALLTVSERTGLGIIAIPAFLIAFVVAIGLLLGLSAITQLVGERLFPNYAPLQQKSLGAGSLILACLAPFVGWFGLLPFVALLGLGALIGGWLPPKTPKSNEQSELE